MKKQFETWLKQYDSKYKMIGDLSWFDSIIININKNDFYQIGIDSENNFVLHIYRNDEFYIIENTQDSKRLYDWQNLIEL